MAAAASALFLVFDFGGVITANAFPGLVAYSEHVFDLVVEESTPGLVASATGPSTALVATVAQAMRPKMRAFFSAVNKFNGYVDGESNWEKLERGKIDRAAYCAAFPDKARMCAKGLYATRAEHALRKKFPTDDATFARAIGVANALVDSFAAIFDIDVVMSIIERSPLRRNVADLLDFVHRESRNVTSPCPIRLGLITNNWRGMGVDEGIQAAIEHARAPPTSSASSTSSSSSTLPDAPPAPHGEPLFHVTVESHKEGHRKPEPPLFVASKERLAATLPAGCSRDAIDFVFFDDLKPNVRGAVKSGNASHGVVVVDGTSIFRGVVSALRRTGHHALADRAEERFEGRFSPTPPNAAKSDLPEPLENTLPMPSVPVKNLLPSGRIPPKQRFTDAELGQLLQYLAKAAPVYFPMSLPMMAEGGAPIVEYFKGGMSNPTFRVTLRTGSFVLRKQPTGKLLAGAHDVRREYHIMRHMRAESKGKVPVPHALLFCDDGAVLGTPFYVMKFMEGDIIRKAPTLLQQPAPATVMFGLIDALAAFHNAGVPPELLKAARPGAMTPPEPTERHPILRVVQTWNKQYARGNAQLREKHAAAPDRVKQASFDVDDFVTLGARLKVLLDAPKPPQKVRAIPSEPPTLVHGDYKPDNMIISGLATPTPRVVALLDFELSHISDPLCDLGYFCMVYCLPPPRGIAGVEGAEAKLPSIDAVIARYCELTGALKAHPDPELRRAIVQVYMAQACHKLGGIVHGVVVRAMIGNASDVEGGLKMVDLCHGVNMLGLGLLDEAVDALKAKGVALPSAGGSKL